MFILTCRGIRKKCILGQKKTAGRPDSCYVHRRQESEFLHVTFFGSWQKFLTFCLSRTTVYPPPKDCRFGTQNSKVPTVLKKSRYWDWNPQMKLLFVYCTCLSHNFIKGSNPRYRQSLFGWKWQSFGGVYCTRALSYKYIRCVLLWNNLLYTFYCTLFLSVISFPRYTHVYTHLLHPWVIQ